MSPLDKIKEAAQRAAVLSVGEDRLITIKVRNYGFLIQGHIEVGTGIRRRERQMWWEQFEAHVGNALLCAVESINDKLGSED